MFYRLRITGFSRKQGSPLICLFIPFVGRKSSVIVPSICQEPPLVENSGFTLIELIITLTVLGVLLGIAVPGISNFVQSNRLVALTNGLVADVNLARSEAIKRGSDIGICKSDNGTSCTASGTWDNGWIIFVDADSSGTWSTGDTVLRIHESLTGNNSMSASAANIVVYNKSGRITAGAGDYTLCNSKLSQSRTIRLQSTGHSMLIKGAC